MATKTTKQHRTKNKTKKLTANPVRNIGFLAWRNNAVALETMRGLQMAVGDQTRKTIL